MKKYHVHDIEIGMFKTVKRYLKLYIQSLSLVLKSAKLNAILVLVLGPLQAITPFVITLLLEKIVDSFSNHFELAFMCLVGWCIAFALQAVLEPVIKFIQGLLTDTLVKEMTLKMMKKSEELQGITYFENANFNNDISFLKEQITWRPVNIIVFSFSVIESLIIIISMDLLIFKVSWIAAIITLIAFIPQCYFSYQVQKEAFETTVVSTEDNRELNYDNKVVMSKEYAKETRLYHTFPYFIHRYSTGFDTKFHRIQRVKAKKTIYAFVFSILNVIVCASIFVWMVFEVHEGRFLIGSIVMYGSALMYISQSMSRFVEDSSLYLDTLNYMEKFFNFLNVKDTLDHAKEKDGLEQIHTIEFRNVHFTYPNQKEEVLKGVSFTVDENQKLAIVGENGSGKTTMMKLLCRFYDPTSGEILVNGKNIKEYELNSYRKQLGAIFQDFCKYQLSMKENVMMSNLQALEQKDIYNEAVNKAGIKEIDATQVLGTEFENSHDISGGQWQKVALARSFASKRKVIIMDEPTAALDPRSEYDLYVRFLKEANGKTILFVTHRLAAVKFSDEVLVMKDGKVEAFGTHQELIKENDYYQELYNMQASYYA